MVSTLLPEFGPGIPEFEPDVVDGVTRVHDPNMLDSDLCSDFHFYLNLKMLIMI